MRIAQAALGLALLGELEQPPRAVDVDLARLGERQRERDGGGAMDDVVDLLRQSPSRPRLQPEPGRLMSPAIAVQRSRWALPSPQTLSMSSPNRASASAGSSARTST